MAITEDALGRRPGVSATEGPSRPLSERQLAVLRIIKSALVHPLAPIGEGRSMTGPDAVFEAFSTTGAFKRIYSEAEKEALFGHPDEVSILLKGAVHEELGVLYIASQPRLGHILLGGDTPYQLIHSLRPDAKTIIHPYGRKGIDGVYVPDIIAIERDEETRRVLIKGAYEISSVDGFEKYRDQAHGFRRILEQLGPLARGGFLKVVIPFNPNPTLSFPPTLEGIDIELINLPFTHDEFNRFFQEMTEYYRRTPEHPTIAELQYQGSERARKIRALGEPEFFRIRAEALSEIERIRAEEELEQFDE